MEDNNDDIDEQFHLTKINISDNDNVQNNESQVSREMKSNVDLYQIILLNIFIYTSLYYFHKYYYSETITFSLEKYFNECCYFLYNTTKCSVSKSCSTFLKVTNNSIIEKCCFWIGSYTNPIYNAYCEQTCLLN